MIGLVVTSLGFMVPAILAHRNSRKRMGRAFTALTVTSTLFHSTHHPLTRTIDMTYVYCLATYYIMKSVKNLFLHKRKRDLYIHVGSLGCVALYFKRCSHPEIPPPIQKRFHMLFHITSQVLFCFHALDKKYILQ